MNSFRPAVVPITTTTATTSANAESTQTRPQRRVKSNIKYRNTDSDTGPDDDNAPWPISTVAPLTLQRLSATSDVFSLQQTKPSPSSQPIAMPPPPPPIVLVSMPTFPCPLCKVKFKRHGWLRSHLKRAHGDQMDDTAIGSHLNGMRKLKPMKSPAARSKVAAKLPPVRGNQIHDMAIGSHISDLRTVNPMKRPAASSSVAAEFPPVRGDQTNDTAFGSHINGLRTVMPMKRPAASGSVAAELTPVRKTPAHNKHQHHLQHPQRFESAGATSVDQLLMRPLLPQEVTSPASDGIADIASIKTYFDSLNPQHSSTIVTHLDQIFRQSAKLMVWLKRQTARPQRLDDFDAVHMVQRELLAKQLKLYDTASQLIAAKRDSVKFAYDDFVLRHSTEVDEDDEALDHEDYSYSESGPDSLELDGQRIVSRPTYGRSDGGGSGSGSNGSTAAKWSLCNQSTQTDDGGGDSRSEIRIKDGDDFEFLDSKTGKLFTNKTSPKAAVATNGGGDDDEEDYEEYQLLDVIEVDEEPFSSSEEEAGKAVGKP